MERRQKESYIRIQNMEHSIVIVGAVNQTRNIIPRIENIFRAVNQTRDNIRNIENIFRA